MTKIKDVTTYLETIAPLSLQEKYDNCGLLTGDGQQTITGVLLTLDCTEAVVEEALDTQCNLIIAHHPIIFNGLKKITGKTYVERTVIKAIRNQIAIYAIHTNLDNVLTGVNNRFAQHLGLKNIRILSHKPGMLRKLVSFVPPTHQAQVLEAVFQAGAGKIGNYSGCSFTTTGMGSFTPNASAHPTIGQANQPETVEESRIEVLVPASKQQPVLAALKKAHPYEEVAYYLQPLENEHQGIGAGLVGELPEPLSTGQFLAHLKKSLQLELIKYTPAYSGKVHAVALCGGAGSFLLPSARAAGADAYVSADFKYHEYFDAENKLMICDIGHYESEVGTKDLLYDILSKKFSSFALNLSKIDTNPISYFK